MVLSPEHALVAELTDARAARGGRRRTRRRRAARAISSGPTWPRIRPASSPARPRPTRSTASRSRSGSPTTCWRATAPARSWPSPPTTSATSRSPRSSRSRSSRSSSPPDGSAPDPDAAFTGEGVNVNSGPLDGLPTPEAKRAITRELEARGVGKGAVSYRLRDWVFSRQRYWGEPIPLVHCPKDGVVPVPEKDLPVRLPDVETLRADGHRRVAAGRRSTSFVNTTCPKCGGPAKRETNTMPQWAGSCWYYLRYLDPKNDARAVRSRGREGVDGGRPLRRRRRARACCTCSTRASGTRCSSTWASCTPRSRSRSCATRGRCSPTRTRTRWAATTSSSEVELRGDDADPQGDRRDADGRRREDGQVEDERRQPRRRHPRLRRRRDAPLRDVHGRVRAAQALGPARHRGGEPLRQARLAPGRGVGPGARARRTTRTCGCATRPSSASPPISSGCSSTPPSRR